jgi:hypothetical protein
MDKNDINYLRDLAISLEETQPKLAYELMSMALKYRPNGSLLKKKKNEYKDKFYNKVLTARTDGKGERVNAILNGVLLSEQLNKEFIFSWNTESSANKNIFLDLNAKIPDFFDEEMLDKHYMKFEELSFYLLYDESVTGCEVVSGDTYLPGVEDDSSEEAINIIPSQETSLDVDYSGAINKVFSKKYLALLMSYQSSFDYLGIHYRGGDVIYGNHRHNKHAIGDKSAALSMIERVIQDNQNQKIILFGTPIGDTLDDLMFLERKYSNVTLSISLASADYDYLIQDCMMMSACNKLIGMSGTGVIRLAQKFNTKLNVEYFSDVFKGDILYELLLSGLRNPEYNLLQRSYHAVRALSMSEVDAEYLLNKIHGFDPDNKLKWYIQPEA